MKYIFFTFFLFSCNSKVTLHESHITGIYTDFQPSVLEQVRIENKLHGKIFPLPVSMIYLRKDSTYVMGFCDNQVREAGRYTLIEDSLLLYDRYHLVKKEQLPNQSMLYDYEKNVVYFTKVDTAGEYKKYPNRIIPLKKDWVYAHYGFLRGQDMSLDSLVKFYKQESVPFQQTWSDSVKRSLE